MALVEKTPNAVETQPNTTAVKTEKVDEVIYQAFPDMERVVNYKEKTVEFEISIPGVQKDNIKLKVLPTWFHLEARRGRMEYNANQSFGVEIVPEKTRAKYDNGLLSIKAFIRDPLDDAKEVQL